MVLAEIRGRIDFAIITIRGDEFEAVLQRFPKLAMVDGQRRYRIRQLPLPKGGSYTVAVVCCTEQGNADALSAARDLIEDLVPAFVLVVGIAGGVPANEFTLGDVVVSTRIVDFSVEAVLKDQSREYAVGGGPLHPKAAKLASDIRAMERDGELDGWNERDAITMDRPAVEISSDRFYGGDEWKKSVREKIERHFLDKPPRPPVVATGAIASSDRLIKDAEILQVWLKVARQIAAIEMESAGVYRATHGKQIPFLAIRGISDVVGFKRHPDWTAYACHSAAAFTRAFLLSRPVPPTEGRLDPLDRILVPGTSPLPKLAGPAALLNARHEIVPFHGRTKLLEELRGWCDGDAPTRLRLVYGPGGMGKTRLLLELCKALRTDHWRAGFVPTELDASDCAKLLTCDQRTVAVIDYAESRPQLHRLLRLVAQRRANCAPGQMRVLLLSRTRGEWWDALLRSDVADLLRDEEPIELAAAAPAGIEREAVFRAAVERFASCRGAAPPETTAVELADPRYDRVLYLHMAALAYVDGRSIAAGALMEDTINHEEQFWVQQFPSRTDLDARLVIRDVRRVVAGITLLGGADGFAPAAALVRRLGIADCGPLVEFLRDLYPGGGHDGSGYVTGLEHRSVR